MANSIGVSAFKLGRETDPYCDERHRRNIDMAVFFYKMYIVVYQALIVNCSQGFLYRRMRPAIYIRPLTLADAEISYSWRNDDDIWKYTEFKPDRYISPEMEKAWLSSKLLNTNEKRFAICLQENNQYIGNIQLLNMDTESAWYHLFIGEKAFWGQGISQKASYLLLSYAFSELDLKMIFLEVNVLNHAARAVYDKIGFTVLPYDAIPKPGFIQMQLSKTEFIYRGDE